MINWTKPAKVAQTEHYDRNYTIFIYEVKIWHAWKNKVNSEKLTNFTSCLNNSFEENNHKNHYSLLNC